MHSFIFFFFFQAEDGIRDLIVTGVQTCALPISFDVAHAEPGHRAPPPGAVEEGEAQHHAPCTDQSAVAARSEERRVGKEWRSGGGRGEEKKKERIRVKGERWSMRVARRESQVST